MAEEPCGRWCKGCDGEGAREETGSVWQAGNVHFRYAVLLCLRSNSAWLKAVSYRARCCEHVKSRLGELTGVRGQLLFKHTAVISLYQEKIVRTLKELETGGFLQKSCVVEALQEFPPCLRAVLLLVPEQRLLVNQEWLLGLKRLLSPGWWPSTLGIATLQDSAI